MASIKDVLYECRYLDIEMMEEHLSCKSIGLPHQHLSLSFLFNVSKNSRGTSFLCCIKKNISFKFENICSSRNISHSQILKPELSNWNRNEKIILSLMFSDVVNVSFCYNGNKGLNLLKGI